MPEAAGLTTFVADNGLDGVRLVLEQQPFLVTLDVNMPGIDGFEAARRIREGSTAYIIMISALDGESDAVLGLTSGADSYLTKPFRPRELRARIDAIMRRSDMWSTRGSAPAVGGVSTGLRSASSPSDASAVVEQSLLSDDAVYPLNPSAPPGPPGAAVPAAGAGAEAAGRLGRHEEQVDLAARQTHFVHRDLELDTESRIVTLEGEELELTRSEFELLAALMESKRRVRSKTDLALMLRGESYVTSYHVGEADRRVIEAHMTNLRRKLRDNPISPRYIETVRGVGYRMTS